VTDADVRTLYWYAGHRYLGASEPDHALLWQAEAGDYTLRVVDDMGRADSRELKVRVVR
jgi:penicillin-binding protein 1C